MKWKRTRNDTTWSKCRTFEIVRLMSGIYSVYRRRHPSGGPCSCYLGNAPRLKDAKWHCELDAAGRKALEA